MSTTTVNISFNTNLLSIIDRAAKRESRTRSELIREAARSYIMKRQEWDQIFASGAQIAKQNNITPEAVEKEITLVRAGK